MSRTTAGIARIHQELNKISGLDGIVADKIEELEKYVKEMVSNILENHSEASMFDYYGNGTNILSSSAKHAVSLRMTEIKKAIQNVQLNNVFENIVMKEERKNISRYTDFEDSFDDYAREISTAYWAEEEEFKFGVHPTQVLERIQERLYFDKIDFCEISFLDWNFEGSRVGVSLDGKFYGIFDYERNIFESTTDPKLNLNQFGLKVECINERDITALNNLKVGKIYYVDLSSINGDFEGDWYGKIYEDDKKNKYVGRFKLSHFKTV